MSTDDEQQDYPAIAPLVAELMTKSLTETHRATDAVIESYKRDAHRLKMMLRLIQDRVHALIDGPWTPSTEAIHAALYPTAEEIDEYIAAQEAEA